MRVRAPRDPMPDSSHLTRVSAAELRLLEDALEEAYRSPSLPDDERRTMAVGADRLRRLRVAGRGRISAVALPLGEVEARALRLSAHSLASDDQGARSRALGLAERIHPSR